MSDIGKDLRKTSQPQKKTNDLLDLTNTLAPPAYVCDDCGIQLALFLQAAEYFPMERGPHYICPKCHQVTDTAMTKPQGMDAIRPLDVGPPAFAIVPDDKGDKMLIQQPYDPEPQEEQYLKNIGATLIDKRIEVKSDF